MKFFLPFAKDATAAEHNYAAIKAGAERNWGPLLPDRYYAIRTFKTVNRSAMQLGNAILKPAKRFSQSSAPRAVPLFSYARQTEAFCPARPCLRAVMRRQRFSILNKVTPPPRPTKNPPGGTSGR